MDSDKFAIFEQEVMNECATLLARAWQQAGDDGMEMTFKAVIETQAFEYSKSASGSVTRYIGAGEDLLHRDLGPDEHHESYADVVDDEKTRDKGSIGDPPADVSVLRPKDSVLRTSLTDDE